MGTMLFSFVYVHLFKDRAFSFQATGLYLSHGNILLCSHSSSPVLYQLVGRPWALQRSLSSNLTGTRPCVTT